MEFGRKKENPNGEHLCPAMGMLDPENITNDDRTVLAETGSGGKTSMHSLAAPSTGCSDTPNSVAAPLQGEQKEVDAPIEAVAEKIACPTERKNISLRPTVWVVHSGQGHGDKQLLEELHFEVKENVMWHDYGDLYTKERQMEKLRLQTPDLLVIWISQIHRNAQPRRSMNVMLDVVCALTLEQQKSGRQVVIYGLESERELWGSISDRNKGSIDREHPFYPLMALISEKKLHSVKVRMCLYGVVGIQTKKPSNKPIRIISTHAFQTEMKCSCERGGHFEDSQGGMLGNKKAEPALHPLRLQFLKTMLEKKMPSLSRKVTFASSSDAPSSEEQAHPTQQRRNQKAKHALAKEGKAPAPKRAAERGTSVRRLRRGSLWPRRLRGGGQLR